MHFVLSVSRNLHLLLTRNDALAMAGFAVISPRTPDEAPLLARERKIDVVIIGHSVKKRKRRSLIAALRRACPECVIVFVYTQPETSGEPLADISLDVTRGPESIISTLEERLRPPKAA